MFLLVRGRSFPPVYGQAAFSPPAAHILPGALTRWVSGAECLGRWLVSMLDMLTVHAALALLDACRV